MATPRGTRAYFEKHPSAAESSDAFTIWPGTDWAVSAIGFGSYRAGLRDPEHRAALQLALRSGCNLIDTSSNYMGGDSERLVGQVLLELESSGEVAAEEVVLVTKVGYLQGENLENARARELTGNPFPEVSKIADDCWHCLHPDFIAEQLTASLERLGRESIDVLLLHNPEYFLKTSDDHREYYRRIEAALAHLETEVARGRIQAYGVSSNTFGDPRDSREFTSLEVLLERAGPGFRVVQFPLNLFEPGAAFEDNQSGKTFLELARARGLATLVNRPLNAFAGSRLLRLAEFPGPREIDTEEDVKAAFLEALRVEERFPKDSPIAARQYCWAHVLRHRLAKLEELEFWNSVRDYQIAPALREADEQLRTLLSRSPAHSIEPATLALATWRESHRSVLQSLMENLTLWMRAKAQSRSRQIRTRLEMASPTLRASGQSLAPQAIRVLRSLPGVHSVLVGMRRPRYVQETLEWLPRLSPEEALDALDSAHGDADPDQSEGAPT